MKNAWSSIARWVVSVVLLAASTALSGAAPGGAAASDEPGTIGAGFYQLYSESQPNHRGPLVVLTVTEGSAAAKAGLQKGDIVVAVNGVPVMGRELKEIRRKDLRGPAGSTLRLVTSTLEGQQTELSITRVPYPPHVNPASDPFAYQIPGNWTVDPRYDFPLPWSPTLAYHGTEDLAFSPDFDDVDSPEYHSYLFFLWLERAPPVSAEQIQSDMLAYFRGLAEERGKNYRFTPDLSKISALYTGDPNGAKSLGGAPAKSFRGSVNIYDTHGKIITLNSKVTAAACPGTNHTAFFFGMSLEPHDGEMWRQLHAIRESFRCSR